MKEIVQYKCKQYGRIYVDKDTALQCEKGHKFATKNVSALYLFHNTDYPDKILVEFDDGTTKEYKR